MAVDQVLNDFSTTAVPAEKTKSWLSMGLIWAGVGISLGMIVTGGTMGTGLSFQQAVLAAFIGGAVLALVTSLCGIVGAKTGLSTAMISQFTFGKVAIIVIALIQAFGSYGWFGVQLGLFGNTAATAWEMVFHSAASPIICIIIGGICMILSSTFGYKGLDLLSKIAVPLLMVLLLASVWKVTDTMSWTQIWNMQGTGEPITVGYGISVAVASFIVGAVVAPDVSRYAKTPKGTIGASVLAFVIVVPLMLVIGILTSQATGEWDIVQIMLKLGWGLAALVVLLLAQWTSNDNNLYCSALGFAVVFKKMKKYQLTILAGIIGIVLALTGIYENITTFLNYLGVLIPPMGGVIMSDFYFFNSQFYEEKYIDKIRKINIPACTSWIIGSIVSYLTTYTPFTLTTAPAIDGLLVAFIVHFVWMKIKKQDTIIG
ncbi:cytosine permease [Zongyangia hominis]|uniref:Cytosine permease n=1 Tax=Zongyangia hominis TaxID=2763677 RepID=A0A926I7H3_9FIRM|nr:cytosine permease [Zongyangia hominis]MBC8571109.1 cytosine permease [Zongyangia hominis]